MQAHDEPTSDKKPYVNSADNAISSTINNLRRHRRNRPVMRTENDGHLCAQQHKNVSNLTHSAQAPANAAPGAAGWRRSRNAAWPAVELVELSALPAERQASESMPRPRARRHQEGRYGVR